jgi:hypothetical protein
VSEAFDSAGDVDELVGELGRRVAEREAAGEYPPGLEDELDVHFERIAIHRAPAYDFEELRRRILAVEAAAQFRPDAISTDTRIPGGSLVHRVVGRLVARQTQGVLEQVQRHADTVRDALHALLAALESPAAHHHLEIQRQLDALFERLAQIELGRGDTR